MKTTITNTSTLTLEHALRDLAEAAAHKNDVSVPLLGLQIALAENPGAAEREAGVLAALSVLEAQIYSDAVNCYPHMSSYFDEITGAVIEAHDKLSSMGFVAKVYREAPRPAAWMLRALDGCDAPEDVRGFLETTLKVTSKMGAAAQKLCLNSLQAALERKVIGDYLAVVADIAEGADVLPSDWTALTLYTNLTPEWDANYAPDFLFYENGAFSLAGAKTVRAAQDSMTLALIIERLSEGLSRVPASLAETIVCDLKTEIAQRLAGFISEKCTEKLSPAGLACLDRIPALLNDTSVPEGDELDAAELTEAVSLLSYVATADKDGALLSLSELSLVMNRSLVFRDALAERAASALLLRVLNELDSLHVELPPVETVLTRLYLALNLRGAAALTDETALSWVCEEA